ncbi:polyene glycosyltransferase [Micromonospora sp. M71_S20]|uniref:glycosyltransferase n=1 Tax=Micromonospora sp. M71_S20 TaxID=592872 RepID=UPI000EB2C921|nr:glycosyltransferase [Micromonospora sp. M71_S20]RLK09555.1 polyene glycosyltransferase [Micromonospora sp. M71_S20]
MTDGPLLFASVSAHGQLNPLLTVAGELSRRRVDGLWFATTDDARAEIDALTVDAPVGFASLGAASRRAMLADWDDETYDALTSGAKLRSYAAFVRQAFDTGFLTEQFERTLAWVDELRPRLMVIDVNSFGAIDAAGLRGIPYVLSVPFPVSALFLTELPWRYPTPFSGLPRTMTAGQQVRNVLFRLGRLAASSQPAVARAYLSYVRARRAAGVRRPAGMSPHYLDRATDIVNYSLFGLEHPFERAPRSLRMVGTVVPPLPQAGPEGDELRDWLDSRDSVVYIAFGTIARLRAAQVAAIVDAAARLGPRHHVLWKLPTAQQALLPADLPANLRIESWLPSQLDVLAHPHVRAFFSHGGGNSVHEALRFGKPLLVTPFWLDCYDIAARVVEAGAALPLRHRERPDPAEIAAKLDELLTGAAARERAAYWAERLTEAGGTEAVADLVLKRYADVG